MTIRKILVSLAIGSLAVFGLGTASVVTAPAAEAHIVPNTERRICYWPGETTYQMLVRGCAVYRLVAQPDVDPRTCYDRHPYMGYKLWGSTWRPSLITSTVAGYTPTTYRC